MEREDGAAPRMGRRSGRILAMQVIYAHDISPLTGFDAHWSGIVEALELGGENLDFAKKLAEGAVSHLLEINGLLAKFLRNWSLDRVGKVTMAVMREAVYELLYMDDIPPPVTINEAIEIVKLFGESEAAKFVNGVLDSIRRHIAGEGGGKGLWPAEERRRGDEGEGAKGYVENNLPAVEDPS